MTLCESPELFQRFYSHSWLVLGKTVFLSYVQTCNLSVNEKDLERVDFNQGLANKVWQNQQILFENRAIDNLIRLSIAIILKSVAESGDFIAYQLPLLEWADSLTRKDQLLTDSPINNQEEIPKYSELQITIDDCQLLVNDLIQEYNDHRNLSSENHEEYIFTQNFILYLARKIYTQFSKALNFCLKDDLKTGGTAFCSLVPISLENALAVIKNEFSKQDSNLLKTDNLKEFEEIIDCIESFLEKVDFDSESSGIKTILKTMSDKINSGFGKILEKMGTADKFSLSKRIKQEATIDESNNFITFFDENKFDLSNTISNDFFLRHSLLGRKEDTEELTKLIEDDKSLLIAIIGSEGLGKSALAQEVYNTNRKFNNKFWVDLIIVDRFDIFAKHLIKQFSFDLSLIGLKSQDLIEQSVTKISLTPCLLVIDNFECIPDKEKLIFEEFLDHWLERGENSKIIVTNREELNLSGKSKSLKLEHGLDSHEGSQLLKTLGVKGDDSSLADFVKRVDGNPLLIKLLSSFLESSEKLSRLNTIDLGSASTKLMNPESNHKYRYLDESIFPQIQSDIYKAILSLSLYKSPLFKDNRLIYNYEFDYDVAKCILPEEDKENKIISILERLVDLSLLKSERRNNKQYFKINPIVQEYTKNKIKTETGINASDIYENIIKYLREEAKQPPLYDVNDIKEYIGIFDCLCEQKNFKKASEMLDPQIKKANGDKEKKNDKSIYINTFLKRQGSSYSEIRISLYQRLIEEWKVKDREEQKYFARILNLLGQCYYATGKYSAKQNDQENAAVELYRKSLEMAKSLDDRKLIINNLNRLGTIWRFWGKPNQATQYHEKAHKIAEKIDETEFEAVSIGNLGSDYQALGLFNKAYDCAYKNLSLAKELGDYRKQAISLANLGNASREMGRLQEACQFFIQSLRISQEKKDSQRSQGMSYGNIGRILFLLGKYNLAEKFIHKNLELAKSTDYPKGQMIALTDLANLYREQKKYDDAIKLIQESQDIRELEDDIVGQINSKLCLGKIYQDQENYKKALEELEDNCLDLLKNVIQPPLKAKVLLEIAYTYTLSVKVFDEAEKKAKDYLRESLAIRKLIESDYYIAQHYEVSGHILFLTKKDEDREHAIQNYQKALDLYRELKLRHRELKVSVKLKNIR